MRTFVALFSLLVLTAGCMSAPSDESDDADSVDPTDTTGTDDQGWPDLADAKVRPGARVVSSTGSCTSNFVFRSSDNATLYLGLAAHCLEGVDNETVEIAGGEITGTVAYNSWETMDGMTSTGEADDDTNDFALIEIPEERRHLVHPAILHFGGPTGTVKEISTGDRTLSYGNTPIRDGSEEANPREGYVIFSDNWYTTMYAFTPGIPGDSGSAVLTGDGQALGVLIHLGITPFPASNGVVNLHAALEFAALHGDIDAELVTWDVLDEGVFPDL